MKKSTLIIIIAVLIFLCVGGIFGYEYMKKFLPEKEFISAREFFDVSGDQLAIIRDHELSDTRGICRNNKAYVPLSYVTDNFNEDLYWDSSLQCLLYVYPDRIDRPGDYILNDGEVYVGSELISQICPVVCDFFPEDAPRLYINTRPFTDILPVKKDTVLRTGESVKQRGIISLKKDDMVTLLREGTDPDWSRIYTKNGYQGYVQTKCLDKDHFLLIDMDLTPYTERFECSHITFDSPLVMAWHQVTNPSAAKNIAPALENAQGLDVISPTWFSVTDNEGNCSSLVNDQYISDAHGKGLQVWALVDNFSTEINSKTLLSDFGARRNLIDFLVNEAAAHEIDGINVDFEQLPESAGDDFREFIRELSVPCRAKGIVLSVDVPNSTMYNSYYGRTVVAKYADYLVNMGYDEHYAGGEPGSVSSYPFFTSGIDTALMDIPPERIIGGIPFYTRLWENVDSSPTSQALGLSQSKEWFSENISDPVWDSDLGQFYGRNGQKEMWLEENESLGLKIDHIKSRKLGGVAGWKLGLDDPDVWSLLVDF